MATKIVLSYEKKGSSKECRRIIEEIQKYYFNKKKISFNMGESVLVALQYFEKYKLDSIPGKSEIQEKKSLKEKKQAKNEIPQYFTDEYLEMYNDRISQNKFSIFDALWNEFQEIQEKQNFDFNFVAITPEGRREEVINFYDLLVKKAKAG